MNVRSLRARVTGWFLLVLGAVMAALAAGGWLLLSRSVIDSADEELHARLSGTRAFIGQMQSEKDPAEIVDEFQEFAELTNGESLLEVTDPSGRTLVRPAAAWWADLPTAPFPDPSRAPALGSADASGRSLRVLTATVDTSGRRYRVTIATPTASALVAVRRFGIGLAALAPVVLLAGAAGGYWISKRALAPVGRISAAASAITVQSLNQRLDVEETRDELQGLAVAFNDMLTRLQIAIADIGQFTADASHELRAPIALMRTTAEVALGRDRPAAEYRQALGDVAAETGRLSTLVDDLLGLARADAGVDVADLETVDLRDAVRRAAGAAAARAAAKPISLDLELPQREAMVRGHVRSLVRLFQALIDNAVKYTPAGGAVTVTVGRSGQAGDAEMMVVRVADTGPGVSASDAPRIFDRFYRGRTARAQGLDGSGLGLSLAAALAARAGGTLALVSTPDTAGAVFDVRIPAGSAADAD